MWRQTILHPTVKKGVPTLHPQAAQHATTAHLQSADDVIRLTTGAVLHSPVFPEESHTAALPGGITEAYTALGSSTTADDVAGVRSSIPPSSTAVDGSVPGGLWNVLESTAGSSHQVLLLSARMAGCQRKWHWLKKIIGHKTVRCCNAQHVQCVYIRDNISVCHSACFVQGIIYLSFFEATSDSQWVNRFLMYIYS